MSCRFCLLSEQSGGGGRENKSCSGVPWTEVNQYEVPDGPGEIEEVRDGGRSVVREDRTMLIFYKVRMTFFM